MWKTYVSAKEDLSLHAGICLSHSGRWRNKVILSCSTTGTCLGWVCGSTAVRVWSSDWRLLHDAGRQSVRRGRPGQTTEPSDGFLLTWRAFQRTPTRPPAVSQTSIGGAGSRTSNSRRRGGEDPTHGIMGCGAPRGTIDCAPEWTRMQTSPLRFGLCLDDTFATVLQVPNAARYTSSDNRAAFCLLVCLSISLFFSLFLP